MRRILFFIIIFSSYCAAQNDSESLIVTGNTLVGKEINGEKVREVIGNVKVIQGDVTITCQRALQYLESKKVELEGDVVAVQDSVIIKTPKAFYDGNKKTALTYSGIFMRDNDATLRAKNGEYFFDENRAYFFVDVMLQDTSALLYCDTLNYFEKINKAVAVSDVTLHNESSSIYADSLIHWRDEKRTFAINNVKIVGTADNLTIWGQRLEDFDDIKKTTIAGDPLLIQIDTLENGDIDTLLIAAKKMISYRDSVNKFIAVDSVKIVRSDFASVNDSTVYYNKNGEIFTVKIKEEAPVLWYENSQLIGDTVKISLEDKKISSIEVSSSAFIISENEQYSGRFDQISGSKIRMGFKDSKLNATEVFGDVLSIYYLFEEEVPNGLVKSSSKEAKIFFESDLVSDVKLYGFPATEYYPEKLVAGKELSFTLPSFKIVDNRPKKNQLLNSNNFLEDGKK